MKRIYKRSILFTKLSVPFNTALAIGKFILGIFTSFFLCISALYNIGVAVAKAFALRSLNGSNPNKTLEKKRLSEYDYYMVIGGIIALSSVMFIIFSVRLFLGYGTYTYPMVAAIAIAAVTFTEITIAIRGFYIMRKERATTFEAIKMINIAVSMISLVLTQTAILSFTKEGENMSFYNGISGIIFGGLAALLGTYMILRALFIKSGKYEIYLKKMLQKLMMRTGTDKKILLLDFKAGSNFTELKYKAVGKADFHELERLTLKKLRIRLILDGETDRLSK